MRDGKIDDLRDFTPQGLKRLEAWLEAWFRLRAGRGGGGTALEWDDDGGYMTGIGGHVIEDEGTPLPQRTYLDFVGADVTATDDSGNDKTIVTVTSPTSFTGVADQLVGYWYTCQFAKPGTNATPANGACHAIPFIVPRTTTYDRIGVYCTTSQVGSAYRLGIYNDASGYPGSRVIDAGTVATTSTGELTITISQQLAAGLYWLVAACQTSGSSATVAGGVIPYLFATSTTLTTLASASANGGGGASYALSGVTGALPDPFTAFTGWISTGAAVTPFVRVASVP